MNGYDYVQKLLEHGLQVVPCKNKRPAVNSWTELQARPATRDEHDVWFNQNTRDIGCITGYGGLLVVDLDDYKGAGARAWFDDACDEPIETWVQETGGGGVHYWFRTKHRIPSMAAPAIGVDIKCVGGFAVCPPTLHHSGREYKWVDGFGPFDIPLQEAPDSLIEAIMGLRSIDTSTPAQRTPSPSTGYMESSWGEVIDGREQYARNLVWARVQDCHSKGLNPETCFADLVNLWDARVKSRVTGDAPNLDLLEREGRGVSFLKQKWSSAWKKLTGEPPKKETPATPFLQQPLPKSSLIVSGQDFVSGFTPPDYIVHGFLQRGYLYTLTAQSGHGKTAVTLALAESVAGGRAFAGRRTEQGRVLYLAGENPDDIRSRFLIQAACNDFDPATLPIYFLPRVLSIRQQIDAIHKETLGIGEFSLVVVDTAMAFFDEADANDNAAQKRFAASLRLLIDHVPGRPAVVVNCHPTKASTQDDGNLIPMGGVAFVNEVDGNIALWSADKSQTEMYPSWKFRGADFDTVHFSLDIKTSDEVTSLGGEKIPTVIARPLSDEARRERMRGRYEDENVLMAVMYHNSRRDHKELAGLCGWVTLDGTPDGIKTSAIIGGLMRSGYLVRDRGFLALSTKGRNYMKAKIEEEGA